MEVKEIIEIKKEDIDKKLEQFLKEKYNYSGRMIRNMKYVLNNEKISYKRKIRKSGILKVLYEDKKTNILPIKMDLDIVYENGDLLIINKPPFLLTHPTLKKVDKTLANGIVHYFKSQNVNIVPRFYNRLDMNTSGLIIIAKNPETQFLLQSDETKIIKKYLAIVENIPTFEEKIIEEKILYQKDELKRIINQKGQYAKTIVKVKKIYPKLNMSILECELLTGRTHQIRVHLSHIGHPIIGDTLYNDKSLVKAKRQFLHSYYFKITNDKMNIELSIDMSLDMRKFIEI